ncbi:MAG: PTS transporter subunit EIIC [Mycoplasma sp.]
MNKTLSRFKTKKESKGNTKEFIAKLSKGLMLPIAMLPIAGLFLGVGAAIATAGVNGNNEGLEIFGNFLKIPGDVIFGALPVLFAIAIAIAFTKDAGPAALSALVGFLAFAGIQAALIIPVEITHEGTDAAGELMKYKELIGYNLLFYTDGALGEYSPGFGLPSSLFGSVLGINQMQSSVFGGFLIGFTVAFIYNKFKNIQLPAIIGFFSGVRFVPIMVFIVLFPITVVFLMLWPLIGILFNMLGGVLGDNMVGFNSFIFGYVERALVPLGLHHAFYSPLWYTSVGGSLDLTAQATIMLDGSKYAINMINGVAVTTWKSLFEAMNVTVNGGAISGDQVLWAAINSVAGANVTITTMGGESINHILSFSDFTNAPAATGVNVGQYMQGKYAFMMFGLPAAAAAMVMAAPKENRKLTGSIVISAALTSFLTGITEPLEFTFLFLAPWLFWGVHAFFCALSFGMMNWFGLMAPDLAPHIGMTFSGGFIDWIVYGAIQIPSGSNAWWALALGAVYAPMYYFSFYYLIKKFDVHTPGRGDNVQLFNKEDFKNKKASKGGGASPNRDMALNIIQAYGGIDNIKNVDACITKLRIQVGNQGIVDEKRLTSQLGAMGTIKPSKQSVYSIYGAKADLYKNEINTIISEIELDPSLKEKLFKNLNTAEIPAKAEVKVDTNKFNKEIKVYAPCDCKLVNLKEVPDATFSDKIIGDGVAIMANSSEFNSIIEDGKLELAFPTGHAYSFLTDDGTQILMHIGVDSISLKDGDKDVNLFKSLSKTNDKVSKKTRIVDVDLTNMKKFAKSDFIPIVVLNETLNGREIVKTKKTEIKKGKLLFTLKLPTVK